MPQHAPARRRTAPIQPRRISGPARHPHQPSRPRAVPAVALPAPGPFERIRALPDKRVVDRLLRGRLCIWVIGVMLGGIVAMQVSLLRMNAGISRAVSTAGVLELQNSDLEAEIARSTTGDKVREAATAYDMIDPPAGEASFLHARPGVDPALAVKRMTPPSDTAIDVMANGGRTLNTTVPLAGAPAVTPVTAATATPAPTVTQATATATPIPTPVATPVPGTDGAAVAPTG